MIHDVLKYFDILMGVEFFQDPRENLISTISDN